jgi:hypothetical protein
VLGTNRRSDRHPEISQAGSKLGDKRGKARCSVATYLNMGIHHHNDQNGVWKRVSLLVIGITTQILRYRERPQLGAALFSNLTTQACWVDDREGSTGRAPSKFAWYNVSRTSSCPVFADTHAPTLLFCDHLQVWRLPIRAFIGWCGHQARGVDADPSP